MNIIRKHKLHKNFATPLSDRETIFLADMKHYLNLLTPSKTNKTFYISYHHIYYHNHLGVNILTYDTWYDTLIIENINIEVPFIIRDYGFTKEEGIEIITYFFKEKYKNDAIFSGNVLL